MRSLTSKVKSCINVCHYSDNGNGNENEKSRTMNLSKDSKNDEKINKLGSFLRMMNDDTVIIEGKTIIFNKILYINLIL